jgi:antitoxin PrlF
MQMEATLTSKGQLTLPKPARDQLGLTTGSTFEVRVTRSGDIVLSPIRCNPLSIAGMLKQPRAQAVAAHEVDKTVGEHLVEMDERIRKTGRSSPPGEE